MFPMQVVLVLCQFLAVFRCQLLPLPKCQDCHSLAEKKINVHIIPHSHMDAGWLSTFDQYYFGQTPHNRGQTAGVQYILTSTINALLNNPQRRFVHAETAFFWKWWKKQNSLTRENLRKIVNNGQFEIVNGGMTMNDEATTNYQSIIDQFTWGLRILNETLGECSRPKIAWQIDSFGHSLQQAALLSRMGYEGLVVERLDYRDKKQRLNHKLEFLWKTPDELFTTMFPNTRNSDTAFCYDILCSGSEAINDDPDSPGFNILRIRDAFETKLAAYKIFYQSSNIMIPMGGDFHYQSAETNFANLDKLIKSFSDHEQFNVFYSTPSCYVQAATAEISKKNLLLTVKSDDFFPIATDEHSYWTGYYSSRPCLKKLERLSHSILQSVKQMSSLSRLDDKDVDGSIQGLREVMGVIQHHDAITGTSKQAVSDDYVRVLTKSLVKALEPLGEIIGHFLKKDRDNEEVLDLKLEACLLANVSICKSSKEDKFLVVVQNPLGQAVNHYVRLPVDAESFTITGPDGNEIYDIFEKIHSFDYVTEDVRPGRFDLVFLARNVPGLGLKVYFVVKNNDQDAKKRIASEPAKNETFGDSHVGFSVTNCKLSSFTIESQKIEIEQELEFYPSFSRVFFKGENDRSSGAYIFRPAVDESLSFNPEGLILCRKQKGTLVEELVQIYQKDIVQIIRIYKAEHFLEFDWIVGNLQFYEEQGVEVISKFKVFDFDSNNTFYTDANARGALIERKKNKRLTYPYDPETEPVSSNYYPVSSRIAIRDVKKDLEVFVVNDRGQGGSSLEPGGLELMIHRRLLHDDKIGVDESLNEREYNLGMFARGQHYLLFGSVSSSRGKFPQNISLEAYAKKLVARKVLQQPLVMVGKTDRSLNEMQSLIEFKFEVLKKTLPENVNVLTFEPWLNAYLLRLEHFVGPNEDETLSQPVTINLKGMFNMFEVTGIKETSLGANLWLKDVDGDGITCPNIKECASNILEIKMKPLEIRTFVVTTNKNNKGGKIDDTDDNDDGPTGSGTRLHDKGGQIVFVVFISVINIILFDC